MMPGLTPADWIAHHAERRPQSEAVRWRRGACDWHTLNRAVDRWTACLAELGLSRGDRLLVALPNSPETIVLFSAAANLGAIFAPVDPRSTSRGLDHYIDHTEPHVLVTDRDHPCDAEDSDVRCIEIDLHGSDVARPPTSPAAPPEPASRPTPDDDALLMYSSGTTGESKAAVHTWRSILWNHRQFVDSLALTPRDTYLAVAPFHHIAGLHTIAGPLLYIGGTIRTARAFDPGRTAATIDAESITCSFMVPTMWRQLLEHPSVTPELTDEFRVGLVGGAPTSASLIRRARRAGIRLLEGYGMTEAGPMVSLLDADDPAEHDGGIGRPGMHVAVRSVDDDGAATPPGEIGELQVAAPNLMDRYWRAPDLTDAALNDGWFATGDLGRVLEDGRLTFAGRLDDMFVSGGENIFPGPIERALQTADNIDRAAVVGVDSERWGRTVTAIVEPAPQTTPSLETCRRATSDLAHFERPRQLVRLQSLPRTATGKIRRAKLRRLIERGDMPVDEQRDDHERHDD